MRSSGTFTVPSRTSPPNPTGASSPVMELKTVVFPEPANPTRPIFMNEPRSFHKRAPRRSRRRGATAPPASDEPFTRNSKFNFPGREREPRALAFGPSRQPSPATSGRLPVVVAFASQWPVRATSSSAEYL